MPTPQGESARNKEIITPKVLRKIDVKGGGLSDLVQDAFSDAKAYRADFELAWSDAYDAYHSKFPTRLDAVQDIAKNRGIWVNMTRRKVNSAKVKINALLFESGKIPFNIRPNMRTRYIPPELRQLPPHKLVEESYRRAQKMESLIRDIFFRTDYMSTLSDVVLDMCLYGTGITKAVTLKHINFPVFEASEAQRLKEAELELEKSRVPVVEPVSIWNLFVSPEATTFEDAEYFIQRSYYSLTQLKRLIEIPGFQQHVIEEIIAEGDTSEGDDQSDSPSRYDHRAAERLKKYEVLEYWGSLNAEDLEPHMDVPKDMPRKASVVITVLNDRVLRVVQNPFDGRTPYHFCYWQKNPDVIWGDGIYFNIRDHQALANFVMAQIVEGKAISSNPMMVIDPMAFEKGEDFKNVKPGKVWKVKPGSDVNQAFRPVIIPDVSNGMIDLFKLIDHQTDLDSGQTAIGAGETSQYQTRTATGMSILNSNTNKLTAEVVRSVSNLIQKDVEQVYYWLMADSEDNSIKGDFEAQSTGFIEYLSKEVHNTQLLNMLQVFAQNPEMKEHIKYPELVSPIVRAFSMDPERMVFSEEEKSQKDQMAMQQAEQLKQKEIDQLEKLKEAENLRVEKRQVGEDSRNALASERLELVKQGQVLKDQPDYTQLSPVMSDEKEREMMVMEQMMLQKQQKAQDRADSEDAAELMMEQNMEEMGEEPKPEDQGAAIPPKRGGQPPSVGGTNTGAPAGGPRQPPGGPPV